MKKGDIVFDDGEKMTEDEFNERLAESHEKGVASGKEQASNMAMEATKQEFVSGRTASAEALRRLALEVKK